ncbi:hypothetical protein K504DRAFT_177661 [Pleomassaria siparia CBS 279.74]|uniref:Uncharacterized protein n=1 Tax=Pleomassaria siparia CBS 279.74 TaxID=1314801 RepID=A0A6G1JT42_9PLEO|nr:hypothetical protein K504DRAFT_177661 [Pleomassaria siparia CBS 279.74]
MHDEHPHPLLAQVPLTVSPFLPLPTATTLPYTYKQLPSTLPPSILNSSHNNQNPNADPNQTQSSQQPAYIVSATGVTATPDTILASCLALQSHLASLESSAKNTLGNWEERRRAADLAEKRRVAPGWLDGDVKLLVPDSSSAVGQQSGQDTVMGDAEPQGSARPQQQRRPSVGIAGLIQSRDGPQDSREGDDIDRAFGGLNLK